MREAAGPTTASKTKMKRIERYLKGRQRWLNFPWVTKLEDVIHLTVDADWARDPKTRCSTSGGALAIGQCFAVRHWSLTQATVSLSSAESEAKAITKGCIEALYVKHLDGTNVQNRSLDGQQMRQGHHSTSWTRAQSKALGGADDVSSTVEQARPHLAEQAGYAGERGRRGDKTRATSSSGQVGRNDGLVIP